MHTIYAEGCLLTPHSYIGVQYLGERRVFKARDIKEPPDWTPSSYEDAERKLSELSLNGSSEEGAEHTSPAEIYKVTARTKLIITSESTGGDVTGGSHNPTFSDVGGLKKQTQLLRELVLRPLKAGNKDGMFSSCFVRST